MQPRLPYADCSPEAARGQIVAVRRLLLAAALVPLLAGCGGARTITTSATTTKGGVPKNERALLQGAAARGQGRQPHDARGRARLHRHQRPVRLRARHGRERLVVDLAVVQELGLKRVAKVGGFTGVKSTTSATIVRVPRWKAGEVQLPAASIASVSLEDSLGNAGLKGLLGSDVLSRYDVVTIDYRGGELPPGAEAGIIPRQWTLSP